MGNLDLLFSLVFCSLSNSLSSIVRDKFKVEDLNFYTKCKWLCDQDMNQNTNEELQCLPFTAAVSSFLPLKTNNDMFL